MTVSACDSSAASSGPQAHHAAIKDGSTARVDSGNDAGEDGAVPNASCDTCNLDGKLARFGDKAAVDCGMQPVGPRVAKVVACVEKAIADGKSFRVTQALQGTDSQVSVAWTTIDDGELAQLSFDSNICGGGGGSLCSDTCGPRVSATLCRVPSIARETGDAIELIACATLGPVATLCEPGVGDVKTARLRALDESAKQWSTLAAAHGDTYWYDQQSCGAGNNQSTHVQVMSGKLGPATVTNPPACDADAAFVYADFVPATLPELYDSCRTLLDQYGAELAFDLSFDDEGIVQTCKYREPRCADACEEGFHLSQRGFDTPKA